MIAPVGRLTFGPPDTLVDCDRAGCNAVEPASPSASAKIGRVAGIRRKADTTAGDLERRTRGIVSRASFVSETTIDSRDLDARCSRHHAEDSVPKNFFATAIYRNISKCYIEEAMSTTEMLPPVQAQANFGPRDYDFHLNAERITDWCGGNKAATAWFNALSLMFPEGERFFIQSVAAFKNKVTDPVLLADIKAFTTQEALHTREHIEYNEVIGTIVDAVKLETDLKNHLAFVKKMLPKRAHLAATCALEHFTAILAHESLSNPYYFHNDKNDESFRRLWMWHALEETEHKAVSFDVMKAAFPGNKGYWMRCRVMLLTTLTFARFTSKHVIAMYKAQGMAKSPKAWLELANFLFGNPGHIRKIVLPWLQYFKPGFHPNDIDDKQIVADTRVAVAAFA